MRITLGDTARIKEMVSLGKGDFKIVIPKNTYGIVEFVCGHVVTITIHGLIVAVPRHVLAVYKTEEQEDEEFGKGRQLRQVDPRAKRRSRAGALGMVGGILRFAHRMALR